jgi:VIT1/CCC1 family predicted Fe2+/Mn2+ transporter
MVRNPEQALDALAREELGVNPADLGSPWGAAISSFLAFAVGAMLPLLPFLLGATHAVALAVGSSAAALFLVGATLSLYSGRPALWGGARMCLIGALAGGATWGAGRLFGAVV